MIKFHKHDKQWWETWAFRENVQMYWVPKDTENPFGTIEKKGLYITEFPYDTKDMVPCPEEKLHKLVRVIFYGVFNP